MDCQSYRRIFRKFVPEDIAAAQPMMEDFQERAEQVARLMFSRRYDMRESIRSYLLPAVLQVRHEYMGTSENFPEVVSCALDFPFEWLNKTDEELNSMYDGYWEEFDRRLRELKETEAEMLRKIRESNERRILELKETEAETLRRIRESSEFKEYKKLKAIYGKYDDED